MTQLYSLALAFLQVGIGAFGGGLSTLPLIYYQLVTHHGWLSAEQFNQVLALSQITPGPIAINAATFVGYGQGGPLGAIIATLSIIGGPLFILSVVIMILSHVSAEASSAFTRRIKPIVGGLLILSLISPLKATVQEGAFAIAMFVSGILLLKHCRFIKEHPPVMLFLFGIIGALFLR
jgi:chromate transporter